MDDDMGRVFESRFDLDDAKLNTVQRWLNRPNLMHALASTMMFLVFATFMIAGAARSWITAYADGTDDFEPVGASVVAAVFLYFLWTNAKTVGAVAAHAWRPDSTICQGQVDGVSLGPCTVRLGEEAISWDGRDFGYALHLAGIHNARSFGNYLFMRNNIPETRFAFGPDMAEWAEWINERRKDVDPAGWPLPDGENWRRYKLPREDYQSGLSELELKATPPGKLALTVFSVLCMAAVAVFGIIGLTSEPFGARNLISLLFLVPAAFIFYREARWLKGGYRRYRAGMSPYGRDVADVTHGDSAFRIGDAGIDIHRALLRKTIRWEAVASVEQKGGWLSLRAADMTLDVLPSSVEVVDALNKVGFDVPCGPWERAEGTKTWKRAA